MDGYTPEQLAAIEKYNTLSQLYYPIAIWVESLLYGLYTALFIATCRIMFKKKAVETFASRVFLVCGISNFILSTIHTSTALYRLVRGYAQLVTPPHPYMYFNEYNRWDNFSHLVILALCTWIGDGLVIYRCFLIWRRNYWVIAIPMLFLFVSMVTTFVNWRWFQHPSEFDVQKIIPVLNLTFPLNLAQNVLTTGLISYKIYMQHRASQSSGLQLSAGIDLMTIIRIIVESAMVYTIATTIIIILFFIPHPAVVIPQFALPPVIGIVFSLIAVRTHVARVDSRGGNAGSSLYPTWLSDNNDAPQGRRNLSMPITVTTVTEQHDMDVILSPTTVSKMERAQTRSNRHSYDYGSDQKV